MAVAQLVESRESPSRQHETLVDDELTGWIVYKVNNWEDARNTQHQTRWKEYYRLWRGQHSGPEDKIRQHERSKIIAPALQQAIEAGVSEMEETIFHRRRWFDLQDDVRERIFEMELRKQSQQLPPQEIQALAKTTDTRLDALTEQLLEDFETKNINKAISEILLNAGLYGTGIGKITVEQVPRRVPITGSFGMTSDIAITEDIEVSLVAVDPNEFVIDTAAREIKDAEGCAHIYTVPRHEIVQKQERGIWNKAPVGLYDTDEDAHPKLDIHESDFYETEHVEILEYHGLVPKDLFENTNTVTDPLAEFAEENSNIEYDEAGDMVEAIVWIANRSTLLKAVKNPFMQQDRSFVSFQWDTVPNRFWGRGIAEKGYNPQKALDAELRARIDALALATYPVALVNGMMAPRNGDFNIRPGRNIVVSGPVNEAMAPFKFPGPDAQSYRQAAEFERMVTVATGSMDTAAPLGVNPRNETAGGMSMMMGALLKRAKRTLRNIEYEFLSPLIHKVAWRYMQFDTERYPVEDYKFRVHGALGAQAREFEVAQLTQLMQSTPPNSPAYYLLLKGVIKNYNIEDKEQILRIADNFLQKSLNPPKPQPDFDQQVKLQAQALKEKEFMYNMSQAKMDEARKTYETEAEAERDRGEAIWNQSEALLNVAKAQTERMNAENDGALKHAKAAEALAGTPASQTSGGTNPPEFLALVDALKASFSDVSNKMAKQLGSTLENSLSHLSERQQMFPVPMDNMHFKIDQILENQQRPSASPDLTLQRGSDGRVLSIGGKRITRGSNGEITGVE